MTNLVPLSPIGTPAKARSASENTLRNRIQEFLDYMRALNRRPRTIEYMTRALQLLELFVDGKPLHPQLFTTFDAWLFGRKLGTGYAHQICQLIRQFFIWCRKMGYLSTGLCFDICDAMPRIAKPYLGPPKIFSYEEYVKLRDAAVGTPLQWAFILAYHTGMALVDCCHLRWDHVDLDRMWIKCARIKIQRFGDAAICEIPIVTDSDLHQELLRLREETPHPSGYVCPELQSLYSWKDSNFRQTVGRFIRSQIGNQDKVFHTFRRTFISNVVNSGMSTALACKLTAHSDPKMLMRYLKPDENALREGVENALTFAKQNHKTKGKS